MMKEKRKPLEGMTTGTFVHHYKGQSQMDTNTICGIYLSSRAGKMMLKIIGQLTSE